MSGWRRILVGALALVAVAAPVAAIGLHEEQELGARFALEARRRFPLVREPAVTAYLQRAGRRLVARLDAHPFPYRFAVVGDPSLNAFAVPGGYVYVHAGLLTAVGSEDELAGVLAHEIVHVQAHHVVRQQEKTALVNYGTLLGLFLSAVHPALGAGAAAAGAAVQLKYQREFEQEADHVGLTLMHRAGFDPAGMPAFLRRVQREQRLNPVQVPAYFLSHPLTEDRVAALEQRVAELATPSPRADTAFELAAAQATVRVLLESRAVVRPEYEKRLEAAPASAAAAHLLGLVDLYGGRPDLAVELLARAVTGKSPRAVGDQARALVRLGRTDEARPLLEEHLRTYADDAPIRMELARAVLAAGEVKAAAALFREALDADPDLDDAEYGLAEASGKLDDTRGQWWHLARAYALRGEFDRALGAYGKARELSAKDSSEREEADAAIALLRSLVGPFGG